MVVAAAGVPGIIRGDMVKPGAAVLDVGVSRDAEGKIAGDVAPDVLEVAGWVSPNPGGVGPMTRAMLLQNVVLAASRAQAPEMLHVHARYLRKLERDGRLQRRLEFLPDDKALAERRI